MGKSTNTSIICSRSWESSVQSSHTENGRLLTQVTCGSNVNIQSTDYNVERSFEECVCKTESNSNNIIFLNNRTLNQKTLISTRPEIVNSQTWTDVNSKQQKRPVWHYILRSDTEGDNFLFLAILFDITEFAIAMIDLVPDYTVLNHANNMSQTALHLSAHTDNAQVSRRLVVAGAKVHMQDKNGNSPLHIACSRGNVEVAKTLVSPVLYSETKQNSYEIPYQPLPQNMEVRNYNGHTCLLLAAMKNHRKIIDLLLESGTDINSKDLKTGKTCLHIAAELGNISLVKYLISKRNINLDAKTYAGYTPAEHAYYRHYDSVVEVLKSKGSAHPRDISEVEKDYFLF